MNGATAGPEGTNELHEGDAQMPVVSPVKMSWSLLLLKRRVLPSIHCSSPVIGRLRKNRLGPGLLRVIHVLPAPLRRGQPHCSLFLGQRCETLEKENLYSGQNFK